MLAPQLYEREVKIGTVPLPSGNAWSGKERIPLADGFPQLPVSPPKRLLRKISLINPTIKLSFTLAAV